MRHISLTIRFAILLFLILLLVGSSSFLVVRNVYFEQLRSQGRNIADNVEAFGTWVARYGRVWVREDNDSFLGHMEVSSLQNRDHVINFYSKNPALAQREFSEIVQSLPIRAKFRMTSHNYMNPANRPDSFEENALDVVRSQGLDEYENIVGNTYRYAKTVYHKAGCIKCHGHPDNAPEDVKSRYGTHAGFGFKEGDVAGVISVSIPTRPLTTIIFRYFGIPEIGLIVLAVLISALFVRRHVIVPILRLTEAADAISVGKNVDLGVGRIPETTRHEIDRLALAVNRLNVTVQSAVRRIRRVYRRPG